MVLRHLGPNKKLYPSDRVTVCDYLDSNRLLPVPNHVHGVYLLRSSQPIDRLDL